MRAHEGGQFKTINTQRYLEQISFMKKCIRQVYASPKLTNCENGQRAVNNEQDQLFYICQHLYLNATENDSKPKYSGPDPNAASTSNFIVFTFYMDFY